MINTDQIHITRARAHQRPAIVLLLQNEKLPTADLPPSLDHFLVAIENNQVVGAIGLEPYDACGLLRSAVVDSRYRSKAVGSKLVTELETLAVELQLDCLYLFTETAPDYFHRKGYVRINRDQVPTSLQVATEFTHACPASAIVMQKIMTHV